MSKELPRYELIFNEGEMEGVYGVSLVNSPAIEISAMKFNSQTHNCNFSNEDYSDEFIDLLLSKGEKIDNENYELIDVKEVTDESVYGIELSSVPTQTDGDSSQDNELFLVRYDYSPSTTSANSRNFCIKVASSGLSFKKEDLESSDANPGFGPGGTNTYNCFLYKGGVNCQHSWSRKIYLRKNNKKMNVYEALKWIGNLDKETAKKAKFEINPKEVGQVASSENNYWKLSTELKDFKMASEEKRILTSPVLLPEQNIYRELDGEQCNVFLTAKTIENLQLNFAKNKYNHNSTLEHKELINGVYFFESWIVANPTNDKANELGFNVPTGTWMMSMKVENQQIWDEYVKTGKITGFSIDSRLGVAKKTQQKNNKEKMNYNKVKEMVMAKILLEAQNKEFKIDDSLSVFTEALEMDMVVFDKDNNPLAEAEFVFEGNTYKTDSNGVIVSVEPIEAPKEKEVEVEAADELPTDEAPKEDTPDVAKLQGDLDEANKKIAELEIENQSLKAELVTIKDEAIKLAKQPATDDINLGRQTKEVDLSSMTPLERYRYLKTQ